MFIVHSKQSLTHCCAWPAEGRSVLHIERSLSTESNQTKNLKATHRRVQMRRILYLKKYCKRVAPEGQIYGQNLKFYRGNVSTHFWTTE